MIFVEGCWLPAKKLESKIQGPLSHRPRMIIRLKIKPPLPESLPSPVGLCPPAERAKQGDASVHHMINTVQDGLFSQPVSSLLSLYVQFETSNPNHTQIFGLILLLTHLSRQPLSSFSSQTITLVTLRYALYLDAPPPSLMYSEVGLFRGG